jgi:hypothetical protein
VVADVGLAINPSVGSPEELLSPVHAKEVAQAILAAASIKQAAMSSKGAGAAPSLGTEVGASVALIRLKRIYNF